MDWCKLFPWRDREQVARREAEAASREHDMVRSQRHVVERIVYELGMQARQNHFVDIVHAVAKGVK
jgi:hypothetical protein